MPGYDVLYAEPPLHAAGLLPHVPGYDVLLAKFPLHADDDDVRRFSRTQLCLDTTLLELKLLELELELDMTMLCKSRKESEVSRGGSAERASIVFHFLCVKSG